MGLAPLHTWLPDTHSEAPSVVSALLSGALLNCAFLTILRIHAPLSAAHLAAFRADLLVLFGLISMVVAAIFLLGQADFKRMLAYSSVEHMGTGCSSTRGGACSAASTQRLATPAPSRFPATTAWPRHSATISWCAMLHSGRLSRGQNW